MDSTITPFRIAISDDEIEALRSRLRQTRWPEAETVDDWTQGTPLAYVREVCEYWAEHHDWRVTEARLNAMAQFTTPLPGADGEPLDIHFLHVRSPEPNAMPLVLTHGWPGSIIEFLEVIGPLTDPVSYGGNAADAFHVVCPSLPGYGFSAKPTKHGWTTEVIADAWGVLMKRLGYDRYGAQGGDWGAMVTTNIGRRDAVTDGGGCIGIHVNMAVAGPDPATMNELTEAEQSALAGIQYYMDHDSGYSKQQSTRPQSLGYGLVDSPAGQAAWILEKFWAWTDNDGNPESALTRDQMLDNICMYWFTAAGASSARLYWESFGKGRDTRPITIPSGISIFPKEIFRPSQRWAAQIYTDIRQYHTHERGGHFAAFEQPKVFVDEVRSFFALLR